MAQVKKTIGKLPVHKGAWVSGTAYARLNQVTDEGSCLQSKIDNNTTKPIAVDMASGAFTVNANWQMIADGTTAIIAAQKANEAKDAIGDDLKTRQGVFRGFGFKAGDNTVNLKTPKINLGHDDFTLVIWARTEGSSFSSPKFMFGANKGYYDQSQISIAADPNAINGIVYITMQSPLDGAKNANSIPSVKMADSTKNQHTIIIKRQGTRVVCKVNGRLIKEVIQDRTLDFSEFTPYVANTSYFSSLRLLNFYTDDAMDDQLWNGGRVDEVVLDADTKKRCLLELLPQNIHSKGIYNTGTLGSSHDAVLSKPDQTIFIKETQYKDKQMITGAPNFHPIAMGQECTDQKTGNIYKASVPPVSREWAVADWKQINK